MLSAILVTTFFVFAGTAPVLRNDCFNGKPIEGLLSHQFVGELHPKLASPCRNYGDSMIWSTCTELDLSYAGNVGEFGKYFEGDILLTNEQERLMFTSWDRNGLRASARRWPDKTVVFEINEEDFDENQIGQIKEALDDIANNSCIKFRERRDSEHAVIIQGTANGCFSNVGYAAEEDGERKDQVLNLAKGCFRHGTIVHEMLHTIGFYHMQSTYNRDEYVKIIWENIKAGTEHNFAKYSNETVTDYGVEYDYGSVMHYPDTAFSCGNQTKTIVPLKENITIGQRNGLSESDILKLNRMYCE